MKSWDDATADEIRDAKIQQLEESIQHLKYCVEQALRYGRVLPAYEGCVGLAADMLDEEWGK